jgi:hypothetical protein
MTNISIGAGNQANRASQGSGASQGSDMSGLSKGFQEAKAGGQPKMQAAKGGDCEGGGGKAGGGMDGGKAGGGMDGGKAGGGMDGGKAGGGMDGGKAGGGMDGGKAGGGMDGGKGGGKGGGEGVGASGDAPSGNELVDKMVKEGQLNGPQKMLDQTAKLASNDPDMANALKKFDESNQKLTLKEGQLPGNVVGLAEKGANGNIVTSENGTDKTLAHELNHIFDFNKITSGKGHDATFESNLAKLMDGKQSGLA